MLNENVNEPLLQIYWRQMNKIYFAPINHLEIPKLRLIFNGEDEGETGKDLAELQFFNYYYDINSLDDQHYYSHFSVAWALEKLVGNDFFKVKGNCAMSERNLRNFTKLLYFLTEVSPLINPGKLNLEEVKLYPEAEYSIFHRREKRCCLSTYLKEEEDHLDEVMALIPNPSTEFDSSIDDFENELYELRISNGERILALSRHIQSELKSQEKNKPKEDFDAGILRNYLENEIRAIEVSQISESMTKILDVSRVGNDFYYFIEFEKAFSAFSCWVSELNLVQIDKNREVSALTFYTIPQKTPTSHISQNVNLP